jgi:hypothetical protein
VQEGDTGSAGDGASRGGTRAEGEGGAFAFMYENRTVRPVELDLIRKGRDMHTRVYTGVHVYVRCVIST